METIHLFVELLDQYFSNVCEVTPFLLPLFICLRFLSMFKHDIIININWRFPYLQLDIVFHFNKVYAILDEFILAGEVQETNKKVILDRMKDIEKLEWVRFILIYVFAQARSVWFCCKKYF